MTLQGLSDLKMLLEMYKREKLSIYKDVQEQREIKCSIGYTLEIVKADINDLKHQ